MIEKKIEFRKRRELGEIISDSFEFIKQEYQPVSKLIFRYVLPFLVLYGIAQVYFQMKILGNIDLADQESMMTNIGPFYLNIFLFSLFGIFVQSLLIGTFYSYIEIYVKKGKGNFELTEITPYLFSNGLLALGGGLVYFIVSLVGLFMFIIPGVYFANTFSLLVIILIFEKQGIGNAMAISWKLVNTKWWNTFFLCIVGLVFIWIASFVLSIPTMITGAGINITNSLESGISEQPQWYWIWTGISTIISSILWIFPYTFLAFQYFNLEEREKENLPDVQQ